MQKPKDTIVSDEHGFHQRSLPQFEGQTVHTRTFVGRRLTMGDGSAWFHPYSGSGPFIEEPAI